MKKAKFEVYYSPGSDQYYNRLVAPNGKIVQDGCEGYKRKANAKKAYKWFNPESVILVEKV